jgi:hypothetical protein
MFKPLVWCTILVIGAVAQPVSGHARQPQLIERRIKVPGTDYDIAFGKPDLKRPNSAPKQALIAAIETWLSMQFNFGAIDIQPRIELAPPEKIVALRSTPTPSDHGAKTATKHDTTTSVQFDTVALYDDATQTIYLPQNWSDRTPAELSVLVHEMVHHFQNVLGLRYECPQAREGARLSRTRSLAGRVRT